VTEVPWSVSYEFIEATAKPGTTLGLIDTENNKIGEASLYQLRGGLPPGASAVMVRPREFLLACDIDGPKDSAWASKVRVQVRLDHGRLVDVASGRPSHGHLWIVCPPGYSASEYKRRLIAKCGAPASDVRAGGSPTRPPLSPHRSGHRTFLVEPDTTDEALRILRRPSLPEQWARRLREGDYDDRYGGRTKQANGLACAYIIHQRTERQFVADMLHEGHLAGAKWQAMSTQRAHALLAGIYVSAKKFLRQRPPFDNAEEIFLELAAFERLVNQTTWKGQAAQTEFYVLTYMISAARKARTTAPQVAVRTIAHWVGSEQKTVRKALARLRPHWISLHTPGQRDQAHKYRLNTKLAARPQYDTKTPVGGQDEILGVTLHDLLGLDAFRKGALPKGAAATLLALSEWVWDDFDTIHARKVPAGSDPSTIHRHLAKAEVFGLVEHEGETYRLRHGWLAMLEDVADASGTTGRQEAALGRIEADRRLMREFFPQPSSGPKGAAQ
jgi:hypothetical protein